MSESLSSPLKRRWVHVFLLLISVASAYLETFFVCSELEVGKSKVKKCLKWKAHNAET